jgi:very-short-patch-repair endonuclease
LAAMKYKGKRKSLPECTVGDMSQKDFLNSLLKFYSDNGIVLDTEMSGLTPFENFDPDSFPESAPGKLRMEECMVLGKFPLFSSSIQRDFDELSGRTEINAILNDLISSPMDLALDERTEPLTPEQVVGRGLDVTEGQLTYINELNSAQEQVIAAVGKLDELVVQGPPGTGKSQVITGLITTSVNEGGTVLMVSEKKTALDVVYSRLGNLSKYVMLIDDVNNKDLFYDQLRNMLSSGPLPEGGPADIAGLSEQIESRVAELKRIADGMFSPGEFGIEPYRMYSQVKKVDLNDPREFERYNLLRDNISSSLMAVQYDDLLTSYEKFKDPRLVSEVRTYYGCLDREPWLALMRSDLSDYDVRSMKHELAGLEKETRDWRSMNFVSRLFAKGEITRHATGILDKYFRTYSANNIDQIINRPLGTVEGLEMYDDFMTKSAAVERLPKGDRTYVENIIAVNTKMPGSFDMSNDELFTFIVMDHLRRFEAANRQLLQDITDFERIRNEVDALIAKKREATRQRIAYILRDDLRCITDSKMSGEISRIADSRRRWSVGKFISRFGSDLFRGIKVWLMTPEAVSELMPLEMGLFDLLVFDEASQMYVENGLPSIYRAKKVVVAGDQKQLRPSSLGDVRFGFSDEDTEEGYLPAALDEESLLDLARARYDSVLLNFHYRSRYEELIAFSNYAFYGGRLYVSPNIDVPDRPPIETHLVKGALWEDRCNRKEAAAVVELLREILMQRREHETVGVIAFNVAQRDLINDLLDEKCASDSEFAKIVANEMARTENGEDVGLFLKNIESVQGDERDIIIFSVGYARNSNGVLMQRFGWLNNAGGENRLNVAISRAKKKVHIVTSFRPEELRVDDSKNDGPRFLRKYLEYAFAVSNGDRDGQNAVLASFGCRPPSAPAVGTAFDDQIFNALKARGYDVVKGLGIGGYRMDVAVRRGDRYILGIECDCRLYCNAASTRERDYHRQKYLESRGWRVRRVWSNVWWNDPKAETDDIAREIDSL